MKCIECEKTIHHERLAAIPSAKTCSRECSQNRKVGLRKYGSAAKWNARKRKKENARGNRIKSSESTDLLLTLHRELHEFKDDPKFHNIGFGVQSRFRQWMIRVYKLQSVAGLETLAEIDVMPGDLLTLGLEYLWSKGEPTAYTLEIEPLFAERRKP